MPWQAARIEETCKKWDAQVQAGSADRGLVSYDDFQKTMESTADTKAQMGYKMPRNRDGTLNLDQAVKMKYQQTQVVVRAYYSYMGQTPPGGMQETRVSEKWAA